MDCAYLVLKGDEWIGKAAEGERNGFGGEQAEPAEVEVEVGAEEYLEEVQNKFLREVFALAVQDEFEEEQEHREQDQENNVEEAEVEREEEEEHGAHDQDQENDVGAAQDGFEEEEDYVENQALHQLDGAVDSSSEGSDITWDPMVEARKRKANFGKRRDYESSSESSSEEEESPVKIPPKKKKRPTIQGCEGR